MQFVIVILLYFPNDQTVSISGQESGGDVVQVRVVAVSADLDDT